MVGLGGMLLDSALVVFIVYRRAVGNHFYRLQDTAQNRFSGTVEAYLAGTLPLEQASVLLKAGGRPEREAAKKALLSAINVRTRNATTQLLVELGFVQQWGEQAFGKRRAQQLLQRIQDGRRFAHGMLTPTELLGGGFDSCAYFRFHGPWRSGI